MPRPVSKPAYFRHHPSGQARVRIDGRDHYLGPIDSPKSLARYDELLDTWLRARSLDRATLTVDELALRFLAHAKTYYVKAVRQRDGEILKRPTGEVACVRAALRPLIRECGTVLAANFGPLKLKAVRESMIQAGAKRKSINKHVQRIRLAFRKDPPPVDHVGVARTAGNSTTSSSTLTLLHSPHYTTFMQLI